MNAAASTLFHKLKISVGKTFEMIKAENRTQKKPSYSEGFARYKTNFSKITFSVFVSSLGKMHVN
jgi:hypothetical protein